MKGYVGNKGATAKALNYTVVSAEGKRQHEEKNRRPWYLNLGDIGFWLRNQSMATKIFLDDKRERSSYSWRKHAMNK